MMKKNSWIGVCSLMMIAALVFTGCSGSGSSAQSGEKRIVRFAVTVNGQEAVGIINETAHTISLTLPAGTDLKALVPVITVSEGAAVVPASGAKQDFSTPVSYTVTAENGSDQVYIVTIIAPLPLKETIEAAESASKEVVVSVDGSDVARGKEWVTAEVKAALDASLKDAKDMLADPEATEAEKGAAAKALAEALAAFNDAKQEGTKTGGETADKTALNSAIDAATAAKNGVVVNTAAANVDVGTQWVTQAALDTFNTAIGTAEIVAAKADAAQAEVDTAATTLNAATAVFNNAKREGTKQDPGTGAITLSPPAEFTDLAETVFEEGPTVRIYRQGTEDNSIVITADLTNVSGATIEWFLDSESLGTAGSVTLTAMDYFPGGHHLSLEVKTTGAVWSRELTVIIDSGSKGE